MSNQEKKVCACCGKELVADQAEPAFIYPDILFQIPPNERASRTKGGEDVLIIDERYYIRGIVPIPVIDRSYREFSIGMWAEVNLEDFKSYLRNFRADVNGVFQGKVANFTMANFDTETSPEVTIRLRGSRDRPAFLFNNQEAGLGKIQKDGIMRHDIIDFFQSK